MMHPRWAVGLLLLALPACSTPAAPTAAPVAAAAAPCTQTGTASWYRPKGGGTSGALVAAHPTLPLGTQVTVTELAGGRSVVVRIVDRGPFAKGRIIDISSAAASQLGMKQDGVAQVRLEIFQPPSTAAGVQPASVTEATCPFAKDTAT